MRWGKGSRSGSSPTSSPLSTPSSSGGGEDKTPSLLGEPVAYTSVQVPNDTSSSGSGGSVQSSGSGGARIRAAPAAKPEGPLVGGLEKSDFATQTRKVDRDAALLALAVLDASPDESLQHFVDQVVQPRFNTSMVALSMLDNDRQFFANKFGLGCRETPIDQVSIATAFTCAVPSPGPCIRAPNTARAERGATLSSHAVIYFRRETLQEHLDISLFFSPRGACLLGCVYAR